MGDDYTKRNILRRKYLRAMRDTDSAIAEQRKALSVRDRLRHLKWRKRIGIPRRHRRAAALKAAGAEVVSCKKD